MLSSLIDNFKKWLWQIIVSVIIAVFFLASFYNYYFYNKINFGVIFFTMLFFVLFGIKYIHFLAETWSKNLVKQFKNPIKANIEKTLVVQKEGHRLSQLELDNIGSAAIKDLEKIIKEPLQTLLYRFSLAVIFTFIIVIFIVFSEASLNDMIQYIFYGECKPISVTK
ncbi:hypothetical protein [Thioflexithrix psekupsensis]|uniref:Uncharacterized protein n=1 Tax=Thioflexithrix psekupsensis TaxID=1570016 RepID=A0A251XCB4_9GAMM|nr:hypothetical protein [Thioflexithrix psekupsensis]OUD16233.1 hypothetical protein TPSD3_00470 [Thioflexithrix psekupsensis]